MSAPYEYYAMLRSSMLYVCETYYNLKEGEIRQLERIEEGFMRQLLKTSKGCPIVQLYTELGQVPARFEISKIRLLFLKYILNQNPSSMIYRFFDIQRRTTKKGDWVAMCLEDLRHFEIKESFEEIKQMSYFQFKKLLKDRVKIVAFEYLNNKKGTKGGDIQYSKLQMAEFLLPTSVQLSIEAKCEIFGMRNKMSKIPANYSSREVKHLCFCGEEEDMEHVYTCKQLNNEEPLIEYKYTYSENVKKIRYVHKWFVENMDKREELLNESRLN